MQLGLRVEMTTTRDRLKGLYGIVGPADGETQSEEALWGLADAFLDAGAPVLQLRHKRADDRTLLGWARELVQRAHARRALVIVNDRLDIALAAGADGVHLGQDDLPLREAKRVVSALRAEGGFLVGVSTHDDEEVRQAREGGADYVGFGPVFGTSSKVDALTVRGVERLRAGVRVAGAMPVVAIGGVTLENAPQVALAGASMGAVISDVARARCPRTQAEALHAELVKASAGLKID